MAKFFEESEIKSIPVQVFMLSFIREIMKDMGRQLEEGIILIADDFMMAKHFMKTYVAKESKRGVRRVTVYNKIQYAVKFSDHNRCDP